MHLKNIGILSRALVFWAIYLQICNAIRFWKSKSKINSKLLKPQIKFRFLEKYNLRYKFWKDAPNYWLLFFYEKKTESTVSNQILLVSKDGGVSFNRWRPTYNEKPLSVDKFFAAKSAVFGLSEVNQTFFYADKDLNIFFAQRYDENESIILSNFDLAYVIKIVVKEFDETFFYDHFPSKIADVFWVTFKFSDVEFIIKSNKFIERIFAAMQILLSLNDRSCFTLESE
ncbi:hypothetical protein RF11_08092 [Thelohanellus kitauei]|uniref:Uncharacterized protein n=1 Tax=Thelohanellus kitauei TaxID=669202 RepID=A0A0C2ME77_THEKT|nr:hypothetical protein RF11_08092 [Thelohanellus kitauei]